MKKTVPNICYTVKHDLCTGCGVCQGACPSSAISVIAQKGKFKPVVDESKCNNFKGCHRCFDACPGVGVNLLQMSKKYFVDDGTQENKMVGRYLKCFTGYSNEPEIRFHAASGGMISQFLIWLLETKKIDGAVVTKFDNSNPLMVSTFIATTKDEILAARSSKYAPVTMNRVAQDVKKALGTRYVIVGVPCHIQGMRKLMDMDKQLCNKVVGLFSLYCSCGRTFDLTEFVLNERRIDRKNLQSFQYRDDGCLGFLKAIVSMQNVLLKPFNRYAESYVDGNHQIYKEEFQSYYHPLRSFFIPRRCLFCVDHYGELADISFGDIHVEPYLKDKIGVNSIVVRKKIWLDSLFQCQKEGFVCLDEVPFEVVSKSQRMSFKKKGRNVAFLKIAKKLGSVVPRYDIDLSRKVSLHDWLDFAQNRVQQFLGSHRMLWGLISKAKAKVRIH